MDPELALTVLETAGLVQSVSTVPETEYAFRHGLVQDSAYHLLLREDRERLHRAVGSALENCFPQRSEELAGLLAKHFLEGSEDRRALHYLRLAAARARGRYANVEAVGYYSQAIQIAGRLNQPLAEAELLRERGLTYEIVGEFEAARQDYEAMLALAEALADQRLEWRALLDLGKLWAARDYEKTGEYFKVALKVAREIGEPKTVARSLNRLGNLHINLGHPHEAKRHHQEALAVFEHLGDQEGIAETLDFLGMSAMMSSDVREGARYYDRAIELLHDIGDKQRLASALTSYALRVSSTQTETVVGMDVSNEQALAYFEEAGGLMRELGWVSGQSFALWTRAFLLNSLGRIDEALAAGQEALDLAREINHVQWMTAASCTLGRTYLEMMDDQAAKEHLQRALENAVEMRSRHWEGIATGLLAIVFLARGEPRRAQEVLDGFAEPVPGMEMLGDRLYWMARAELLLEQEEFEEALALLDRLVEAAPGFSEGEVIARLFADRGRAYHGLRQFASARGQLEAALTQCQTQGSRTLQWLIHGQMAVLELRAGNEEVAQEQLAAGRSLVETIAETISNAEARGRFLSRSLARLEVNG